MISQRERERERDREIETDRQRQRKSDRQTEEHTYRGGMMGEMILMLP